MMIRALMFLLRLGLGLATIGMAAAAIAALLGFLSPLLDAFNHLQAMLFVSTLILLILVVPFFRNRPWQSGMLSLAALGFLASAVTVIPEQIAAFGANKVRPPNSSPVIKLMSNNMFGLNYDMERMANIIKQQNPDIVALQEYFIEQQRDLHPKIVADYPFFVRCAGRKQSFIALYSKTEFSIEEGTRCASDPSRFDNPAARIVASLRDANDREYTAIVTHLNWPIQVNPLFRDELDFGQKLSAMSARKQQEWRDLSTRINRIEGPIVLAGDFNSTSWSYAMRRFTADTGLTRYSKAMMTYPKLLYLDGWRETIPFLPIDHIMANSGIEMWDTWMGEQTGSDHLPLYAEFSIGQ